MTKYTQLHDDYYLQATQLKQENQQVSLFPNRTLISIFNIKDEPYINKYIQYINYDGQGPQPWNKYFGSHDQLVRFFQEKDNYQVIFQPLPIICLKWKFEAKNYEKNIQTQIFLEFFSQCSQNERKMIKEQILRKNKLNEQIIENQLKSINEQQDIQIQKKNYGSLKRNKNSFIKKPIKKREESTIKLKTNTQIKKQKSRNQQTSLQSRYVLRSSPRTKIKEKSKSKLKKKEQGKNNMKKSPVELISRKHINDNKQKLEFDNGDHYIGELIDGNYNGQGFYFSKKNGTYEGGWKDGKAEGIGKTVDGKGNVLIGNFKQDQRFGWGIDKYANGAKYQGYFEADMKSGWGKYTEADGSYYYQGYWKENMAQGKGKQYSKQDNSIYLGQWEDDVKSGMGILTKDRITLLQKWQKGKLIESQKLSKKQKQKFEAQFNLEPPK